MSSEDDDGAGCLGRFVILCLAVGIAGFVIVGAGLIFRAFRFVAGF